MHDIEPYYHWREKYISSDDKNTPFYGRIYDEFTFSDKIYNYYIHPQWDNFGSQTLYTKILFADYEEGFAIIEMIGEWNDCINNDIMFLKRDVIDNLIHAGIKKFIIICENVLNFHGSDNEYYAEWQEDIAAKGGYVTLINTLNHVKEEMDSTQLNFYIKYGQNFNNFKWRGLEPIQILQKVQFILKIEIQSLRY